MAETVTSVSGGHIRKAGYATPVIAVLIRCTAETPTPASSAAFTMPVPFASNRRTFASLLAGSARTAETLSLATRPRQPSFDPLHDDGTLELGEDTEHLEHRFAGRRACVQALLVKVQIHAFRM